MVKPRFKGSLNTWKRRNWQRKTFFCSSGVNCVMMELGKRITVLKQGNMDDLEEDMSDFPQMGYIEASTGSTQKWYKCWHLRNWSNYLNQLYHEILAVSVDPKLSHGDRFLPGRGLRRWHSMVVARWNGSMGGFLGACVSIKKLTILLKTFSLFSYLIFYLIFYFIYTDLQPILTKYHPQTATLTLF